MYKRSTNQRDVMHLNKSEQKVKFLLHTIWTAICKHAKMSNLHYV